MFNIRKKKEKKKRFEKIVLRDEEEESWHRAACDVESVLTLLIIHHIYTRTYIDTQKFLINQLMVSDESLKRKE